MLFASGFIHWAAAGDLFQRLDIPLFGGEGNVGVFEVTFHLRQVISQIFLFGSPVIFLFGDRDGCYCLIGMDVIE
jgi:hypothetical protein